MTVGVEFVSRTINIDDETIKLQIWDTVPMKKHFGSLIILFFTKSAENFYNERKYKKSNNTSVKYKKPNNPYVFCQKDKMHIYCLIIYDLRSQ